MKTTTLSARRAPTVAFAALAAVVACSGGSPTQAEDPGRLTLRMGAETAVAGTVTHIGLLQVENDSRCPIDAMCVWAGNAVAVLGIRAGTGPTVPYRLNTGLEPRTVDVMGYRVRLDSLLPRPRAGQAIPQGDYVAYVTATPSGTR